MLSDTHWRGPLKWNREAERAGVPAKVFCASMADVFEDHPDVAASRERLWRLIEDTPWLRWQLLTKRPENVAGMVPWGNAWPESVWLGTSVENQRYAEQRIPHLLAAPAKTRFLSCEPLLGPVDLSGWFKHVQRSCDRCHVRGPLDWHSGHMWGRCDCDCHPERPAHISWAIIGGESGNKARTMSLPWARDIAELCKVAGVAVFTKQLGTAWAKANGAVSRKGGDPEEWPAELQVRQFPQTAGVL